MEGEEAKSRHLQSYSNYAGSLGPKQSNGIRVHVDVVRVSGKGSPVPQYHRRGANSTKIQNDHVAAVLHTENGRLAILCVTGIRARGNVVVEEAVETGAVDKDIRTAENAETEGVAVAGCWAQRVIVGVIERCDDREGLIFGRRIGHPVGSLSLSEANEDILSIGELVLIESVMFAASSDTGWGLALGGHDTMEGIKLTAR